MDAQTLILPLLAQFANCFTKPGFAHFQSFVIAHMALLGLPHCVTEVMRLTGLHQRKHWTTPYAFLSRGRFSCQQLSQCLLELLTWRLNLPEELIIAIDDTLVKKVGKKFFGLGYYRDPTDKNPGAHKRKVRAHCWMVLALLWPASTGQCFAFPLAALLFIPQAVCPANWNFMTKIELAAMLIKRLQWPAKRLLLVVDNLYAKGKLAFELSLPQQLSMVSRLRSNAALYQLPEKARKPKAGRPRLRGKKVTAPELYRRQRRKLKAHIYGKTVTIKAFVGMLMPSRTLGSQAILVIIFPQRSGKKMNIFFSTDLNMDPLRLLELYAARFKIEDLFDEIKTVGGFADCRQRSFPALKRHATLSLLAYSLLRLVSVTLPNAQAIEVVPWWQPTGAPSVTRLRRAVLKAFQISDTFPKPAKVDENSPLKLAA